MKTSTPPIPASCRACRRRLRRAARRPWRKPIRPGRCGWSCRFNAGGSTDLVGRIICQWLTERLGQSFVVENKPGGGTNIATQLVVNSPPDGYTLLYTVSTHAINPSLYKSLPFDFQRDIVAGREVSPNCRWCW